MKRGFLVLVIALVPGLAQQPLLPVPPVVEAASSWTRLGDFTARDVTGRVWRAGDLRGKVTLVDIWDTGCGPCRREHPQLQRFQELAKAGRDLQVLTFSLDRDVRPVEAYLREHHYTFPVIVDAALAGRLFPSGGGIPQRWLVDREGRRGGLMQSWSLGRFFYEAERLASGK